ncbi:MAG: hypothetical protein JNL75_03960 [Chitinophagales bacterium]|nr:hypothetical protein [Chitinophagales bacterium]
MLEKLKAKWGVNNLNLILILCTFAIGGSLCGFLGRKALGLLGCDKTTFFYWPAYILAMTILWPLCVITVSIFTGQFIFFRNYLKKIFKRFSGK